MNENKEHDLLVLVGELTLENRLLRVAGQSLAKENEQLKDQIAELTSLKTVPEPPPAS